MTYAQQNTDEGSLPRCHDIVAGSCSTVGTWRQFGAPGGRFRIRTRGCRQVLHPFGEPGGRFRIRLVAPIVGLVLGSLEYLVAGIAFVREHVGSRLMAPIVGLVLSSAEYLVAGVAFVRELVGRGVSDAH